MFETLNVISLCTLHTNFTF